MNKSAKNQRFNGFGAIFIILILLLIAFTALVVIVVSKNPRKNSKLSLRAANQEVFDESIGLKVIMPQDYSILTSQASINANAPYGPAQVSITFPGDYGNRSKANNMRVYNITKEELENDIYPGANKDKNEVFTITKFLTDGSDPHEYLSKSDSHHYYSDANLEDVSTTFPYFKNEDIKVFISKKKTLNKYTGNNTGFFYNIKYPERVYIINYNDLDKNVALEFINDKQRYAYANQIGFDLEKLIPVKETTQSNLIMNVRGGLNDQIELKLTHKYVTNYPLFHFYTPNISDENNSKYNLTEQLKLSEDFLNTFKEVNPFLVITLDTEPWYVNGFPQVSTFKNATVGLVVQSDKAVILQHHAKRAQLPGREKEIAIQKTIELLKPGYNVKYLTTQKIIDATYLDYDLEPICYEESTDEIFADVVDHGYGTTTIAKLKISSDNSSSRTQITNDNYVDFKFEGSIPCVSKIRL